MSWPRKQDKKAGRMKKFTFSLERALSWRRTQARIEEWKLEQLHGERSALEAQRKALEREYSGALGVWVSAGPVTGKDLRGAIDALLAGRAVSGEQRPSLGCNIKWKAGNEPAYYHATTVA